MVTIMVAPETVDHTIQKFQRSNIDVLDQLVSGSGRHVTEEETNMNFLALGSMSSEVSGPRAR